jgi:hypothetical protein
MLSRIRDRLSDFTRSQLGRSSVRDSLENPDKTPQNVASDVVLFRGQNRLNVLSCRELRPPDSGLPARLLISGSLARVPRRFHDLRSEIRCQFVPPCDELTLAEEELRANSWVEAVSSRKLSEERDVPALVVHLGFEARPVVGSPCAVRVGLIDRRIRGVTSRLDVICTFVAIDSRTVTSYGVCRVLITSWAEIP